METALGALLGIIATVLASRYYFRRAVSKSIRVFGLFNSFVFAGIEADVRKQLHFRFKEREVDELQHLVILVANDGERAIRDVIEPLTLTIPPDVEILDASIIHRHPKELRAEISIAPHSPAGADIKFEFPLLNKREFFVVKMLLSGRLDIKSSLFSILSDDLPRTLRISPTPPATLEDAGIKFEWGAAIAAAVILLFPAWISYFMYRLRDVRPELFPVPWASYKMSVESFLLLVPATILSLLFCVLGFGMIGAAVFGGTFPPPSGPRFPLPKELRAAVPPYRVMYLESEFADEDRRRRAPPNKRTEGQD